MKPIVVDAMGGDYAPLEVVAGVADFAREFPDVPVVLVGDEGAVAPLMKKLLPPRAGQVSLHHTSEAVGMHDEFRAARKKKDSSIYVSLRMVKDGEGSAFVSLGNTAAVVGLTHLMWGLLKGVSRAGVAVPVPSVDGVTLCIDMGANVNARPEHLFDYAIMASIYCEKMFDVKSPRVGMLNVGTENGKGGEAMRKAFAMLEEAPVNFQGNAEGGDLFSSKFDVVVCDGFVGNAVLKVMESAVEFAGSELRKALTRTTTRKVGAFLLRNAFSDAKRRMDYSEYGGTPLLGVNGICTIGHGRSKAVACKNAVRVASQAAKADINSVITAGLSRVHKDDETSPSGSA